MANPPFNISETLPSDNGVVAIFPGQERTFRDVVESWLRWEHDVSGYHSFDMDTEVNRDADTTRPAGSLFYNTDLEVLQFCVAATPSFTWDSISFPPGTRLPFNNAAPPPGWTKETDAAYNDSMIRIVTGTPGAGAGDIAFSTFFNAAYNGGNVQSTAITIAQMPSHFFYTAYPIDVGNGASINATSSMAAIGGGGSNNDRYLLRSSGAGMAATVGPTNTLGNGQGHTHVMVCDQAVKYNDFILCEKDAF